MIAEPMQILRRTAVRRPDLIPPAAPTLPRLLLPRAAPPAEIDRCTRAPQTSALML